MIELSPTLFIALLGGIAPALIWLCFWLFEDKCEPEPKRYIFYTFLAGMIIVPIALVSENFVVQFLDPSFFQHPRQPSTATLFAWATIEELLKFLAAYIALRSWVFDEPLDAVIYLVTAALGFAALENALFIFGDIGEKGLLHALSTGNLRFMGATLLHTLASATIGIALALSFYKSVAMRRLFVICGVVLGVTLHTLFNFFILNYGGGATFFIFLVIWFGIIAVLTLVEKVKQPARDYC